MPSIVTAAQLRAVLGVSSSLYNDAYLDEIINTSEAVILPMLVANTSAVNAYKLTSNVATYYGLDGSKTPGKATWGTVADTMRRKRNEEATQNQRCTEN